METGEGIITVQCTVVTASSFIFFLSYLKWSFLCNLIPTFLCGGMEDYFWWSRKIKTISLPHQPTVPSGCTRNDLMHRERLRIMSKFEISQEEKSGIFKVLDKHCTSRRTIANSFFKKTECLKTVIEK